MSRSLRETSLQRLWPKREQLSIPKQLRRLLGLLLLWAACAGVGAADGTPLTIDPAATQIDLSRATYLLEDPTGTLTIDDVRKPENAGRFALGSPNVGMYTSAHWMRFSVRVAPDAPTHWWFDTGNRTLQEVTLYWPGASGTYTQLETGSTRRFGERPLRVGIHSGPVIAGVVGKRKYAFDIWGDTVNIASRMESSGEPGRVNVSAYTYDLIRNDFACEYRGKVSAKGKGEVDMYFVAGEKS